MTQGRTEALGEWTAPDGTRVVLRRIGPGDFELAKAFLESLSRGTRYLRFGRGDFRYTDDEIRQLCDPDPAHRAQVVAVSDGADGPLMLGSARYVVLEDGTRCEFAIVLRDRCSRHGLGRRLMETLIDTARRQGLRTMEGLVLGSNLPMLAFTRRIGFELDPASAEAQIKRVRLSL